MSTISVRLKILPPLAKNGTIEKSYSLAGVPRLIEVLQLAHKEGLIDISKVVEGKEIREGVVVLVNGKTVYEIEHKLDTDSRIAILPLVTGG
jgi:sulfur carrier protein ThiS